MRKTLIGITTLGLLLVGCTAEPEVVVEEVEVTRIVEQTVEVPIEVEVEVTRVVEKKVVVTATPIPATPTVTPTRIPYNVSACRPLVVTGDFLNDYNIIQNNIEKYEDQCIKTYVLCSSRTGSCSFHDSTFTAFAIVDWVIDDETPEDFPHQFEEAWVWGFVDLSNGVEDIKLVVREYKLPPENQVSIQFDGTYSAGEEMRMAPGAWKNGIPVGGLDDCYWARLNQNGNIIANHFGTTGMTIRVREGELFVTEGCYPWYYIGP